MIGRYKKSKRFFITGLLCLLMVQETKTFPKPSFHDAMAITSQYIPKQADQDPFWRKLIQLYDTVPFDNPKNEDYIIPRIIHHIWLGSELPQVCKEYGQTWIEKHPEWVHILWTDNAKNYKDSSLILSPHSFDEIVELLNELNSSIKSIIIDVQDLSFSTLNQYLHSENFGEKSDILRYEILFHCGGIYTDTDFKCIQPFDSLHKSCTFYTGLNYSSKDFCVFNGLIGSIPKHPICKKCMHRIKRQSLDRPNKDAEQIMARTGPYLFSSAVRRYITKTNNDTLVLFPVSYFYPCPAVGRNKYSIQELERIWLRPESLAIHFWHVSWKP